MEEELPEHRRMGNDQLPVWRILDRIRGIYKTIIPFIWLARIVGFYKKLMLVCDLCVSL
jgi:hypothetical protein